MRSPAGSNGGAQVDGGRMQAAAVHLGRTGPDDVRGEPVVLGVGDVAQPDAAADGFAPGARGHLADGDPVPEPQLAAPDHGVAYDRSGEPVEFARDLFRGDRTR